MKDQVLSIERMQHLKNINEIWIPINGYESLYSISSYGRIKSFMGSYGIRRELILKPSINSCGYPLVTLCKNGIRRNFLVHRLVAESFIPNPESKKFVNHLDEVPINNFVWNLEWATEKENTNWGTAIERRSKSRMRPICQMDINGKIIKEYPSTKDASIETKIKNKLITSALNGHQKTAGGFIWKKMLNKKF